LGMEFQQSCGKTKKTNVEVDDIMLLILI
jgi:hypothetical protein